eukprot:scaffold78070_cov23-Tisochrysis_lutea.AAC.7
MKQGGALLAHSGHGVSLAAPIHVPESGYADKLRVAPVPALQSWPLPRAAAQRARRAKARLAHRSPQSPRATLPPRPGCVRHPAPASCAAAPQNAAPRPLLAALRS